MILCISWKQTYIQISNILHTSLVSKPQDCYLHANNAEEDDEHQY